MASVHSFPPNLKSWQGIIFDGLDFFIRGDTDGNDGADGHDTRYDDNMNAVNKTMKKCSGTLDFMRLIQIFK